MNNLPYYTYEQILERMLARVPDNLDKRVGSVIYDMCSQTALEHAQNYSELPFIINLLYPDTATGEWLDKSAEQYAGIKRRQASYALREIEVKDSSNQPMTVPIGARFGINDITMVVTEEIVKGKYQAQVEQLGSVGNLYGGQMQALTVLNGLGSAILKGVLIDGQDVESDDDFRTRFMYLLRRPAFGGNVADYEIQAMDIDGVGGVQIFPIWNGDGTVKVMIGNTSERQASTELVERVQNLFMPITDPQLGSGLAPVGHTVTADTSTDIDINVEAKIVVGGGFTLDDIRTLIEDEIKKYINGIKFKEEIIYNARMMANILNVQAVNDVQDLKINGSTDNFVLSKTATDFQTPKVGTITLTE